jgi:hypothetical protein
MDDIIQNDMNITLNTATQVVLDITTDYLVSSQILGRINDDLKISMTTSTVFHIIDEIVYKAVMRKIRKYIRKTPLVGKWISKQMLAIESRPYVRALIQIITILVVQKVTKEPDVIELTIIMLNTYFVDYVVEIEMISDVLDTKFDF